MMAIWQYLRLEMSMIVTFSDFSVVDTVPTNPYEAKVNIEITTTG